MHKVKIRMKGGAPNSSIEIDDKKIHCRRVEFIADIHGVPTLVVELVPSEIEIDSEADVLESISCMGETFKKFKGYEGGN